MKNKNLDYFRSEEKVRIGKDIIKIEHSSLENILGCAFLIVVGAITSPIWIPYGIYSGIRSLFIKGNSKYISNEEARPGFDLGESYKKYAYGNELPPEL